MRGLAILFLIAGLLTCRPARAQSLNSVETTLSRYGAVLSPRARRFIREIAIANSTIASHILICAKVKAGLYMTGNLGICSTVMGEHYFLTGSGIGLSGGVAGEIMVMAYSSPSGAPLDGNFRGLAVGSSVSKGTRIALKIARLIKVLPKGIGPDFAIYKSNAPDTYAVMLGVQAGPMYDIAASSMTVYQPWQAFRALFGIAE